MSQDLSLDNFSKSPDGIDVTDTEADVACDMTILGTGGAGGAGTVKYAACSFKSPLGVSKGCLATSAVGNVWSCDATFPADSEEATWTIEYVFAEDQTGSKFFVLGAEIEADQSDGEVDLAVTSTNEDTTPPTITAFDPVSQDVYPGSPVQCRILTDEDPVEVIGCTFLPDDSSASISCISVVGSNTCNADVPAGVDVGVTYNEVNHFARDTALNVTVADANQTFVVVAPPATGTIAVNMSALPGACTGASWTIDPGFSTPSSSDLAPTDVAPGDYTITWLDTALGCTNPATELKPVEEDLPTVFDLVSREYTTKSTFASVNTDVGVDGVYIDTCPNGCPGGPWTMESDDMPAQFAASGTGDVDDVVPSQGDFYVGREYTLTWEHEDDHTAPATNAITTSGDYQGNYIDLIGGGCDSKVADQDCVAGAGGAGGAGSDPCSVSGNAWVHSSAQTEANAILTYTVYARAASDEAAVSISTVTPITGFSDSSMLVRWSASGDFDAYDEGIGNYRADATIPATLNVWHKIIITADIQAGTYSVDIGTCDETPVALIEDDGTPATFRLGASAPGLSQFYYNLWSYTGTAEIEGAVWTPGACDPDECNGPPLECGTPDDGCGNDLDCGDTCGGDVCFPEGTCCAPSTTVCTDPDPNYECDSWSDNCGGTVDCNPGAGGAGGGTLSCHDRVEGDICSNGTCVTPGTGIFGDPYVYATLADMGITIGPGVVAPYPTEVYTGSCDMTIVSMDAAVVSGQASGSGIQGDPYLIENKLINCVTMNIDTNYLTIRNCVITSDSEPAENFEAMRLGKNTRQLKNFTMEYSHMDFSTGAGKIVNAFEPQDVNDPNDDFTNNTFQYNHMEGGEDWFFLEGNWDGGLWQYNVIGPLGVDDASAHADGWQLCRIRGHIIIRGNQFLTESAAGKTALLNMACGTLTSTFESNNVPIFGATTLWCDDNDGRGALDVRYNIYTPEWEAGIGNRCNNSSCFPGGGPPDECCGYPFSAASYRWQSCADRSVAECNRYQSDGSFIENEWFGKLGSQNTTDCPDYTP
jgi:hypothetical protein